MLNIDVHRDYTLSGMAWLLFFSATSFFAYIQALSNIPLTYPVAVLLGVACYLYFLKREKVPVIFIAVNSLLLFACIVIATFLHDFSWDGQAYHMEAVWQLVHGWNIYHGLPLTDGNTGHFIWLNSYPKATWMFGAALYAVTGSLLSCKSYMFILCIANALLLRDIVYRYVKGKWLARGIIFALVANPVVSAQLWTTYLDGALYLICLAVSLLLINIVIDDFRYDYLFLAVVTSATGFNFKFTSVAYVGLIWLCFLTYLLWTSNRQMLLKATGAAIASVCFGLFLLGYNPYITNYVNEGHPFWPVRGTHDLEDVMLSCGDREFIEQNRFVKLGISCFSKSSNQIATLETVEYKIPFTISNDEMKAVLGNDCRIGGFGLWFSGILLLLLISIFIIMCSDVRFTKGYICIVIFLLISLIINPESWVARYAPQLYVLPILILVKILCVDNKSVKFFSKLSYLVIIINTMILFGGHIAFQGFNEYSDYQAFGDLKKRQPIAVWSSGMFETVFETRFKYYNLDYERLDFIDKAGEVQIRGVGRKDEHIRIWCRVN